MRSKTPRHQSFAPINPSKEFPNLWRSVAVASVVFFAGLVLIGRYGLPLFFSVVEYPAVSAVQDAGDALVGGDVVLAPPPPRPERRDDAPPFDAALSAQRVMVKDAESGMTLYGKNEYASWPLASITKLMSALVLLETEQQWSSSTQVIADELIDTHMYAGDTYTREELWRSALVGSSNKAMMTLVDRSSWPREAFVERMNQKAHELGMTSTRFTDPTGLDAGNVSTASDVLLLLNEALKQDRIRETLAIEEVNLYSRERGKRHHMWNTNWLLLDWIPNTFSALHGGKTGYIPASGYNFVMRAQNENGHVLDVVVLGAQAHEARFTEARDAAVWAFSAYAWPGAASTTAF